MALDNWKWVTMSAIISKMQQTSWKYQTNVEQSDTVKRCCHIRLAKILGLKGDGSGRPVFKSESQAHIPLPGLWPKHSALAHGCGRNTHTKKMKRVNLFARCKPWEMGKTIYYHKRVKSTDHWPCQSLSLWISDQEFRPLAFPLIWQHLFTSPLLSSLCQFSKCKEAMEPPRCTFYQANSFVTACYTQSCSQSTREQKQWKSDQGWQRREDGTTG